MGLRGFTHNHRIQKFPPNVTNGQTVAGNASCTSGSTDTLLDKPIALAWLNGTGALFIADHDNHRIMRIFPSNGSLVGTRIAGIGSNGASLAELKEPSGVAVDTNGTYLYVADTGNHRILRWNLANLTINGTLIAGITGDNSKSNNTLNEPCGLALNEHGTALFITDKKNDRIQKLTFSTGIITTAMSNVPGSSTYPLKEPEAIAVDSLDNLYVADTKNNRILMLYNNSMNGTDILQYVTFDEPRGITIDTSFNLYVSDSKNHRVLKFTLLP